jgi:AcrR family transcriptional regulator
MHPHPALPDDPSPSEARREQILKAALACFARRGFRQSTMQDISHEAGISVGLIYRYFENKEQVIASMANGHLDTMQRKFEEARAIPSLFDALERVLWCDEQNPDVAACFVVELFAESARNPQVRELVGRVHDRVITGVTALIAESPRAADLAPGVTPRQAAETVFHAIHGLVFDEIVHLEARTRAQMKDQRRETLRRLWTLLFPGAAGAGTTEA